MLSQPVIDFTSIRAPHEAVVNITWVELHIMFAPLPFFMQHLFKVNEQALGQRHQSRCQRIRVHHTVIPARMPSMENNTRFSLFVTELYLRNRVSDNYVSASSRPTGLRLSYWESMIQLPSLLLNASVLPCGTRNLTISAYLCCHLAARSITSQHSASQ